jgi:hypothetical protein
MDVELARERGKQVGHSLNVVAELPRSVDDRSFPMGLRVAAIDAFFIHLRLLVEFLTHRPDTRDIRCHDYALGFNLGAINGALQERLHAGWLVASRHAAHLSIERVPTVGAPIYEPVDDARLRSHAADVFGAMNETFPTFHVTNSAPCLAGYGVAASRRRRCQGWAASASWRGLSLTSTLERVRSRLKPPRRNRIHVGGVRRRGRPG